MSETGAIQNNDTHQTRDASWQMYYDFRTKQIEKQNADGQANATVASARPSYPNSIFVT